MKGAEAIISYQVPDASGTQKQSGCRAFNYYKNITIIIFLKHLSIDRYFEMKIAKKQEKSHG
jgi:hypothetical protein